jgi:hypothetical protein
MKDVFLCSAFSLQMVKDFPCKVMITEVKVDDFPDNLKSAVGHQETSQNSHPNIHLKPHGGHANGLLNTIPKSSEKTQTMRNTPMG